MLATNYAKYYGIAEQQQGEDDYAFRSRVAGRLRDQGKLIEAHEAQRDARWNQDEAVVTGITGALAQMFQGVDYDVSGEQQVGIDIAAGMLIQDQEDKEEQADPPKDAT